MARAFHFVFPLTKRVSGRTGALGVHPERDRGGGEGEGGGGKGLGEPQGSFKH